MKAQDDIERQLADAQGAWESPPPAPALWERLEQRLDGGTPPPAPQGRGTWPFRIVGIALLALIGAGVWWMLPQGKAAAPQGKAFAQRQVDFNTSAPMASNDAGSPHQAAKGLAFGNQIGIGAKQGSLLGRPDLGKSNSFSRARSGSIFSMNGSGRLLLSGSGPKSSATDGSIAGSTSPASPTYNNNGMAGTPAQSYVSSLPSLFQRPIVVGNMNGNPLDTLPSISVASDIVGGNDDAYLQLNATVNRMNYQMANPDARSANQQKIQHLKWLLGSWKTQGTSGGAIEEWRQKDDFTLLGRGYFVVNGDTIVTEEMRIEQRGPEVYFIIVKDQNHKSVKFRLRSSQGNEAIFENDSPKSAEEIVLRNRVETDELERILQSQERGRTSDNNYQKSPSKSSRVMSRAH